MLVSEVSSSTSISIVMKAFPRVHEVVCSFGFSGVREEHGGVIVRAR